MKMKKRNLGCAGLALAALLASDVTVMTAGSLPGAAGKRLSAQEPEVHNPQDEERMFLEARRALNQEDFDRAAELFQALRTKYHGGRFVADSYYWEAFGRNREGDLPEALALLDLASVQTEGSRYVYRHGGTVGEGRLYRDVRDLRHRIQRQLAEQGDPGAAEEVLRQSEAVLNMDTAAFRAMQQQFEAQMRETQARWEVEQARLQSDLQEAIARYRAQLDSTGIQETLRRDQLIAELMEARRVQAQLTQAGIAEALLTQRQRRDSLAHLVDSAATEHALNFENLVLNPRFYPGLTIDERGIVLGSPDLTVFDERGIVLSPELSGLYVPPRFIAFPGGIDIHPGCEDALIQQEALTSLLRLETDLMPTVRSTLERKDECSVHLRYLAVNWLTQEGTDEAWDLLTEVAREHPDTQTRRWAVTHLASFENPESAEILIGILRESDDREMQYAAISGLYRYQSDDATQALIEFAADGSKADELREEAVRLVAQHIAPGPARTLFERLDSEAVKLSLLEVLAPRGHGDEAIAKWLREVGMSGSHSNSIRGRAMVAWGWLSLLDLDLVDSAYQELADPEFRDQVLYALYQRAEEDEENADAIIDKMIELAREETDPEVRKRAVYWLGRTGSERAAEFLQEILREGSDQPPGQAN